ncbi:alpha-acetolactate decarboxylase [Pyrenophora seminiperda CCB06]|uniref:Alpha-acetolactate decarboxylase n=1 Tax=Pyrenophora seminiperda CCB06 TaxID=1302712 RepID=A0A3M7M179_9PLEO|nr:alpha-acetolactate decarboxylase [Pyrenophora seminiperda CCB06]
MVGSIPNDIFQFSTYAALNAGFNKGQPSTADLTSHGTHGIGVYEDGSLMMLKDRQAFTLTKDGKAKQAPMEARLPLALVTVYRPSFRLKIPSISLEGLDELVSSNDVGPAKGVNTLMPFQIAGHFESVEFEDGPSRKEIDGTVFGFIVPVWMRAISGPRIHAHFLDANEEVGGKIMDFKMAEEAVMSFAKCGRFHLGFPQGGEWEEMKL